MEIFLIKTLQFMLSISILVLLHEGGHFLFARLFGIRVEKFYLFFDPWFHLFEFKPRRSETTYGLGWLPLGGYCKIAGMIDESFDTDQMKQPAQPWEFRSKPAWQRLLVMIGGVLVNFLLALFIYSMLLFTWGDTYIPTKNMTDGMKFSNEAKALGFRDGDILVGTEKGEFKEWGVDMYRDLSKATRADIIRDGKPMSITLPGDLNLLDMLKNKPLFAKQLISSEIDSIIPGGALAKAGVMKGDRIVAFNGKPTDSYNDVENEVGCLSDVLATVERPADSLRVRTTSVVTERDGVRDTATIVLSPELKLGYVPKVPHYESVTRKYGFFESFPAGISYGLNVLGGYVDDMKYVFTADGAKSVGGFGTIGSLFPGSWDWYLFWKMTAFLSIILAFMNILPIPALDGGHVLFLLYEIVTRRKPSENFMLYAEYVGFGILILLMVVANLNDILRWLNVM